MTFFEPYGTDQWPPSASRQPPRSPGGGARNVVHVVLSGLATTAAIILMLIVTTPGGEPLAGLGIGGGPDDEIVALADSMHLTDEGRAIFYDTRPQLVDQAEVDEFCQTSERDDGLTTDGCYGGNDRILIARSDGRRPDGASVTTAAHELLHAAYSRMSNFDQMRAAELTDDAVAAIPADDGVHLQIASSVGDYSESRATEQFSYLGTQFGDLDPELEKFYSRFIADRDALVGVWQQFSGPIPALEP